MANNFESEVQEAMRIMMGLSGQQSSASPERNEAFEAEVQEAMDIMRSLNSPPSEEQNSLTAERALGLAAKGFAEVPGSVVDIASRGTKLGIKGLEAQKEALINSLRKTGKMKGVSTEPVTPSESLSEYIPETELSHTLGKGVESAFGEELTPKTPVEKAISTAGSFLFPIPIPGGSGYIKAAQAGIAPLAKHLGKEAAISGGAASAIHLTPRMTKEGTFGGVVEDLSKALVGAKSVQSLPSLSSVAKAIAHPIQTIQKGLAKGASKFIKPEKEFLEKAERHKIELPFNIGSNNAQVNYIANNYFKSLYASKKYKESLKIADNSMIDAVKRSIDSLGEANIQPTAGSSSFAQYLKEEEKVFKEESDALYKVARKSLSENDKVLPKNTLKALNSEAVKDLVGTISPSASEKAVINRIREISQKLSGGELSKETLKRYKDVSPKVLEKIKKHIGSKHEVPVKELINLRKSLLNTLSYDLDVRGSEAFLSKLVRTLDTDIKGLPNKKFLHDYEMANRFFRENIAQRFRKSMAQSILKNESPVEAYNLMNSVENIRILEKIAGENPKGKELFDSLKKAKVREILSGAIKGDLGSTAEISPGVLGNLFKKGEKRQELLHKLIGDKEYNNLTEISEIGAQFSKDGRELLNTSGTAHALSDAQATKDAIKEAMSTFGFIFGGYKTGGNIGAGGIAFLNVFLPYITSRLLANKNFLSLARAYAIARKQGKDKYSDTIMRKMVVPVIKEIKQYEEENSD